MKRPQIGVLGDLVSDASNIVKVADFGLPCTQNPRGPSLPHLARSHEGAKQGGGGLRGFVASCERPAEARPSFRRGGEFAFGFLPIVVIWVCVNDTNDNQGYFSLDVIREKE